MTDSDSSPVEIDSKGSRITNPRILSKKAHISSHPRSNNNKKEGSSITLSHPIDIDSLVFLSSSQVVRDVVQLFDGPKKKMVESIGFAGLLHLPSIPSVDKSFSLWLLRNLKWFTGSLCAGDNINLTISPEHIGNVIGLNHTGIDVSEKSFESSAEKLSFLQSRLSFLRSERDIVQAAQSFVQAPSPQTISQTYSNNFKVAFVIFVMGRFLAPGEDFTEGNSDFWGALEEPEAINCYNWSSYVLSNILDSARKLEWDMVKKRKLSPICGCTFIIMVFYLDNIDFGTFNREHKLFPRVKHYSNETITRMIECDRCKENDVSSPPRYGRLQMLRTSNSCYKFSIHPVTKSVPSGFTNSPLVHGLSNTSSQKAPLVHTMGSLPIVNHSSSAAELPLVPSTLPSIDNQAMDMSSFINENYPGHLRAELLEAIRSHQERCSGHLQSFTEGLRQAIEKENTTFARRIIEHVTRNHDIDTPSPLDARRISYSCTPEIPDYSSGDSRHQKIRRVNRSPHIDSSKSRIEGMPRRLEIYQAPSGVPSTCQDRPPSNDNRYFSSPSPMNPNSSYSKSISQTNKPRNPHHVSKSGYSHDLENKFQTPEASVKFPGSERTFSPTTENKIFNGIALSARQITSMQTIDLNARSFAAEYSSSPIIKKKAQPGVLALSHWSLALEAPPLRDPSTCSNFFQWLVSTSRPRELESVWIRHDSPRFIQLEGSQLRSVFAFKDAMPFAVFDIIIRRLKQLDRAIYLATYPLRWRHLFESDLSMHVLGDDQPPENIAVRDQFTGPDIDYELCRCSIFFVPVLANDVWWAYAFDMKSRTIFIMDPSNANEKDDTLVKRHIGTMQMIQGNLSSTVNILFSGWNPVLKECKPKVLRSKFLPCTRAQSGFFTLFLIANFDGSGMISEPSPMNIQKFKEHMLHEILDLKGNTAILPSVYVHVLD